jgi:hypothetical protein
VYTGYHTYGWYGAIGLGALGGISKRQGKSMVGLLEFVRCIVISPQLYGHGLERPLN